MASNAASACLSWRLARRGQRAHLEHTRRRRTTPCRTLRSGACGNGLVALLAESACASFAAAPFATHQSQSRLHGYLARVCCAQFGLAGSWLLQALRILNVSTRCGGQTATPNPSLEPTRTGMALGPPTGVVHHPSGGPSAIPALAPQLKR